MQTHFVDAHLHLQDPLFKGAAEQALARAKSAGVGLFFCNAIREEDWGEISALTKDHPEITPFFGIHPWFSDTAADGWQQRLLATTDNLNRTIGIGETGLDRSCRIHFDLQQQMFSAHLNLAAERNWPLSVHCVKAWGVLVDLLHDFSLQRPLPPVLIHSYNGSVEIMRRLSSLGCYISYSEALADPSQAKLQHTFIQTPPTSLLLETDAPYAKNPSHRQGLQKDRVNEPADVAALYRHAAQLLGVDLEKFVTQIWDNATIFTNQNAAGP